MPTFWEVVYILAVAAGGVGFLLVGGIPGALRRLRSPRIPNVSRLAGSIRRAP